MHIQNHIFAIDHHHGQASRTILSGYPSIRGRTMRDKAAYYLAEMGWIHESLLREPRGHRNMLGSIITEPVHEESAFGILFLHAFGLFDGCGDSTFAAAAAAIETGLVKPTEPITRFAMDTVLGVIKVEADVVGGVISRVRFENVPSYYIQRVVLDVPGFAPVPVELAFGGLYFGFIDASAMNISIEPAAEQAIVTAAQKVFAKSTEFRIRDPASAEAARLDLVTFVEADSAAGLNTYRVANVYPPGRMGRTPSGTGTSAHMALRASTGEYVEGSLFTQIGMLGNAFTGEMTNCVLNHTVSAIRPVIAAKSYMMSLSHFVVDSRDPFARGFVLNG